MSSLTDPPNNNGYVPMWPPNKGVTSVVVPPPMTVGRRPPPPPYPGPPGGAAAGSAVPKWPDLTQQLSEALNQLKYLEEEKKRLKQDNQELRDLCCFLDDDRQRARNLQRNSHVCWSVQVCITKTLHKIHLHAFCFLRKGHSK